MFIFKLQFVTEETVEAYKNNDIKIWKNQKFAIKI